MATDLERLVVSLDADITKLTKQLARAGVELDAFDRDTDTKTKRTGRKIAENLTAATNDNARGLNVVQGQILGHAVRSSFEALSAGANPLRVLAQEGVKASAAIGPGGLGGLVADATSTFARFVTPVTAVAGGVVAIGGAAIYAYNTFREAQQKIELSLTGVGRASHATVSDIERIGEATSAASKISVSAGRDIATSLAGTGRIGVENIPGVSGLAKGYAKVFGTDLEGAGQQLAKLFSDPAKGVDDLNQRLGSLDDRTVQYVKTLAAQGDRQEAIRVLVAAVSPELERAANLTSVWAKAWDAVKSAASGAVAVAGRAVAASVEPMSLEAQIGRLRSQRDAASGGAEGGLVSEYRSQGITDDATLKSLVPTYDQARVRAFDMEIAKLTAEYEKQQKAAKAAADATVANELTEKAGAIVRAYDEAGESIKGLNAQIEQLGKTLAAAVSNPDQQIEGGVERAKEAYDALRGKADALTKSYMAGGAAAAAALRQADFQKQVASLNAYERGLREIKFRYDELRQSAIETGNTKALPTIEAQRAAATSTFEAESNIRARSQVNLPPNFAQAVIGAESGGDTQAQNPRSSAGGLGQFIDSTFVSVFKRVFPDRAGSLGSDEAIAGQKKKLSRDDSIALINDYGKELAVELAKAGKEVNGANLQLAYFLGPEGAKKILSADPSANAASILPGAAKSNPEVFKNGNATVADVRAYAQRRATGGAADQTQTSRLAALNAEAEAYNASAAKVERLKAIEDDLAKDREQGGELSRQFASAQDLIAGSSAKLTPELMAQRDEILKLADARARAAGTGLQQRFAIDTSEAYGALGRSPNEQSAYTTAKQFGAPGSDGFQSVYDETLKLKDLTDAKSDTGGFVKGLVGDLMNGVKAGQALENQLKRIVSKLADKAIDGLINSLFSGFGGGDKGGATATAGAGGGAGGIFGSLLGGFGKLFGFDAGGFTGAGGRTEPAGIVHRGEVVWSQADVGRWGGAAMVDAMRRSRGFAEGGIVGPIVTPRIPMARPAGGGSTSVGGMTLVQHIHGGGDEAIASIARQASAQAVAGHQKFLERNLPAMVGSAQLRSFF